MLEDVSTCQVRKQQKTRGLGGVDRKQNKRRKGQGLSTPILRKREMRKIIQILRELLQVLITNALCPALICHDNCLSAMGFPEISIYHYNNIP
jgi:hypothetical protein